MDRVILNFVKKVDCDKNLKEVSNANIALTINCDSCSAVLGYVESIQEARELFNPKDIIDNMRSYLSGYEFECFEYLMEPGMKYYFYDEEYTVPVDDII